MGASFIVVTAFIVTLVVHAHAARYSDFYASLGDVLYPDRNASTTPPTELFSSTFPADFPTFSPDAVKSRPGPRPSPASDAGNKSQFNLMDVNTWDAIPAAFFAPSVPASGSGNKQGTTANARSNSPLTYSESGAEPSLAWDYSSVIIGSGAESGSGMTQDVNLPLADHSPGSTIADQTVMQSAWEAPPLTKDNAKYQEEPTPKPVTKRFSDGESMAKAILSGQVKKWEWSYSTTLGAGMSTGQGDHNDKSITCCQRLPYICGVDGMCVIDIEECRDFCTCAANPFMPHCQKIIPVIKRTMIALEKKILAKVAKEMNSTTPSPAGTRITSPYGYSQNSRSPYSSRQHAPTRTVTFDSSRFANDASSMNPRERYSYENLPQTLSPHQSLSYGKLSSLPAGVQSLNRLGSVVDTYRTSATPAPASFKNPQPTVRKTSAQSGVSRSISSTSSTRPPQSDLYKPIKQTADPTKTIEKSSNLPSNSNRASPNISSSILAAQKDQQAPTKSTSTISQKDQQTPTKSSSTISQKDQQAPTKSIISQKEQQARTKSTSTISQKEQQAPTKSTSTISQKDQQAPTKSTSTISEEDQQALTKSTISQKEQQAHTKSTISQKDQQAPTKPTSSQKDQLISTKSTTTISPGSRIRISTASNAENFTASASSTTNSFVNNGDSKQDKSKSRLANSKLGVNRQTNINTTSTRTTNASAGNKEQQTENVKGTASSPSSSSHDATKDTKQINSPVPSNNAGIQGISNGVNTFFSNSSSKHGVKINDTVTRIKPDGAKTDFSNGGIKQQTDGGSTGKENINKQQSLNEWDRNSARGIEDARMSKTNGNTTSKDGYNELKTSNQNITQRIDGTRQNGGKVKEDMNRNNGFSVGSDVGAKEKKGSAGGNSTHWENIKSDVNRGISRRRGQTGISNLGSNSSDDMSLYSGSFQDNLHHRNGKDGSVRSGNNSKSVSGHKLADRGQGFVNVDAANGSNITNNREVNTNTSSHSKHAAFWQNGSSGHVNNASSVTNRGPNTTSLSQSRLDAPKHGDSDGVLNNDRSNNIHHSPNTTKLETTLNHTLVDITNIYPDPITNANKQTASNVSSLSMNISSTESSHKPEQSTLQTTTASVFKSTPSLNLRPSTITRGMTATAEDLLLLYGVNKTVSNNLKVNTKSTTPPRLTQRKQTLISVDGAPPTPRTGQSNNFTDINSTLLSVSASSLRRNQTMHTSNLVTTKPTARLPTNLTETSSIINTTNAIDVNLVANSSQNNATRNAEHFHDTASVSSTQSSQFMHQSMESSRKLTTSESDTNMTTQINRTLVVQDVNGTEVSSLNQEHNESEQDQRSQEKRGHGQRENGQTEKDQGEKGLRQQGQGPTYEAIQDSGLVLGNTTRAANASLHTKAGLSTPSSSSQDPESCGGECHWKGGVCVKGNDFLPHCVILTSLCDRIGCVNGDCVSIDGHQVCECRQGWAGLACDERCHLDCGHNGFCNKASADNQITGCACRWNYTGHGCQEKRSVIPLFFDVAVATGELQTWEVAIVAVVTAILAALACVSLPHVLWKQKWLPIRQLVFYFQPYEDYDDDKEYDAFVSYMATPRDDRFVRNHLIPKLEAELEFRLCLHFRDFLPGESMAHNMMRAIKNSRRTILILSPSFVTSEWNMSEYQKVKDYLLKVKYRVIPIILEDISHTTQLDKSLKAFADSSNTLNHPGEEKSTNSREMVKFWKLLKLAMPKKRSPFKRCHSCASDLPLAASRSSFNSLVSSLTKKDIVSSSASRSGVSSSNSGKNSENTEGSKRSFIGKLRFPDTWPPHLELVSSVSLTPPSGSMESRSTTSGNDDTETEFSTGSSCISSDMNFIVTRSPIVYPVNVSATDGALPHYTDIENMHSVSWCK